MTGGIKRQIVRRKQREFRASGGQSADAWKPLGEILGAVNPRHLPPEQKSRRYIQGPALTWANLRQLPENEIATQTAMRFLKANVDFNWPRKVTYQTFIEQVRGPLLRAHPMGFNGRPINIAWIFEMTPQKILELARNNVALAAREGEVITLKDALEKFWTRRGAPGFRGLTHAESLSAIRFQGNLEKNRASPTPK